MSGHTLLFSGAQLSTAMNIGNLPFSSPGTKVVQDLLKPLFQGSTWLVIARPRALLVLCSLIPHYVNMVRSIPLAVLVATLENHENVANEKCNGLILHALAYVLSQLMHAAIEQLPLSAHIDACWQHTS